MTSVPPVTPAHAEALDHLHAWRFAQALERLDTLPAEAATRPGALNDRAVAAWYTGDKREAFRCTTAALDADPDFVQAHINQYFWEMSEGFGAHIPGLDMAPDAPDAPMVSVIMPTYDRADLIRESIDSVLSQTFDDLELLVMNDGGSRDVETVLQAYTDPRLTYHYCPHGGRGHVRNEGLRRARGKYIAYLDDDDIFYPDHLATCVTVLEENQAPVAFTDVHRLRQRMEGGVWTTYQTEVISPTDVVFENLLQENRTPILSVVHKRECVRTVGGFAEGYRCEDWEFWIRMAKHFQFHHATGVTAEFRWRGGKRPFAKHAGDCIVFSRNLISWRHGGYFMTSPWPLVPWLAVAPPEASVMRDGMLHLWRRHRDLLEVYDFREYRGERRPAKTFERLGRALYKAGDYDRARGALAVGRRMAPRAVNIYKYALRTWWASRGV